MSYNHLSIQERELARNPGEYLPSKAQAAYQRHRKKCRPHKNNENTHVLLREYFPKDYDFSKLSDDDLQAVVDQFNHRPRKCLGYKTSWELWFSQPLHLA